jgi:hypothetical protein
VKLALATLNVPDGNVRNAALPKPASPKLST